MRRRWLAATAAALTAAASVVIGPAGTAQAANPQTSQFGAAPALGADNQPRAYFQLSVAPGHSTTDIVVFENPTAVTQQLRIGMAPGVTATNTGSAYGPLESKCTGTSCWVIGIPKTVTLKPHAQQAVRFEVKVPDGAKPSQYLAGIAAMSAQAPKPQPVKTSAHGSAQVTVLPRVVIGVAVTVGQLDHLTTKAKIAGTTAGWVDGIVRLTVAVQNTGQRFTKGNGTIACTDNGDTKTFPLSMDTVLPGQEGGVAVNATGMHEGTWQCTAKVKEAGGGTATWAGAVTVASTQPAATKRVGQNAYVVPGGGGIPAWAIALMVLGALILLSLWAVLLRRQRNRNLPPPAG